MQHARQKVEEDLRTTSRLNDKTRGVYFSRGR